MIATTDMLVKQYNLQNEELAVVVNKQLQVLWASSKMQELQMIDRHGYFVVHEEFLSMWDFFLQQLQVQQRADLIMPIKSARHYTVYYITGILHLTHQLIVLTFQRVKDVSTVSANTESHLLNYIQQGIILTTINHSIVHFNQYAKKMIPKQFIKLDTDMKKLVEHNIIAIQEKEKFWANVEKREKVISNCIIDGNVWRIVVSYDVILERYIYMFEDLTELEQIKFQSTQQQYLSEIGEMATALVHEMNNPMTAIKGYVDLMLLDPQNASNYLKIIEREVSHVIQLSSDILFLAKPISKMATGVDLLEIAKEVQQLLQYDAEQLKADLVLTFNKDQSYIIAGNEMYFKQLVLNLVKNALQALGGKQNGVVEICLTELIHSVELVIKDTGCGIEPQQLDNIFEMFYTTKEYGTGLGLPVVKKIVDQLNGTIDVKSTVNIGTKITINLPRIH